MTGIQIVLASIDPAMVIATIISGLIVGFLSRKVEIEKKTKILFGLFFLPWLIGRIFLLVFNTTAFVSGTGIVGTILLLLYFFGIWAGRLTKNIKI